MKTHPDVPGVVPSFSVYLASPDVHATTERATAAGARVTVAYLQDPTGAHVGLWEGEAVRMEARGKPGAMTCKVAIDAVRPSGGAVIDGPVDSPFGRVATVSDDQATLFQLDANPG